MATPGEIDRDRHTKTLKETETLEGAPVERRWRGYGVAVAGTVVAALVRWALGRAVGAEIPPYITFYPAVIAAAAAGGTGPGVAATLLSVLAVDFLFVEPVWRFGPATTADAAGMCLFVALNTGVSVLGGRLRIKSQALRESEARLRIAHQAAHIGAFEWNVQTGLNVWTPELEAMYGLKPGEFGRTQPAWEQLVHPEDRAKAVGLVDEAFKTFQPVEGEWRVVWPDGTVHWLVGRFQVFKDHAGEPLRLAGVNLDITDRKQAEEALRWSEERFRAFVTASSDVVYQMSPDWTEMRQLRGRDFIADTATPSRIWLQTYIDPEDQPHVMEVINEAIRTKRTFELEHRVRRVDGSLGWTFSRAIPLQNPKGEIVEWFGAASDVTKRKEAEQALRRLKEELEARVERRTAELAAANRELNDFATIVSHDLKTPLRGVATLAGWLQSDYADKLDDEARHHLAEMIKRVTRMDRMIEDILQYSRAGRGSEKPQPVALAELVPAAVQDLGLPAHVHVDIAPGLPIVSGEPVRLRQVFQNLVGNAFKYANKPEVEISVNWADNGSLWQFSVADNGPGIEERHFERIFKIFQTLAPMDKTDSTGVGLALVKRIVERAGGRVWVESRLGKGSTFHFTWPKQMRGGSFAEAVERTDSTTH